MDSEFLFIWVGMQNLLPYCNNDDTSLGIAVLDKLMNHLLLVCCKLYFGVFVKFSGLIWMFNFTEGVWASQDTQKTDSIQIDCIIN